MKQLQNNYTTPEQSRRLLELGLPANSADGVYELKQIGTKFIMSKTPDIIPQTMRLSWTINSRIPCWSVGRLIEIYRTCWTSNLEWDCAFKQEDNIMEYLIFSLEHYHNHDMLDFSKLED